MSEYKKFLPGEIVDELAPGESIETIAVLNPRTSHQKWRDYLRYPGVVEIGRYIDPWKEKEADRLARKMGLRT